MTSMLSHDDVCRMIMTSYPYLLTKDDNERERERERERECVAHSTRK